MTELDSEVCLHRRHCAVAALRYVAEHAVHEPQALNRTVWLSSVRKASADVPACVFGRACLLVRHADST